MQARRRVLDTSDTAKAREATSGLFKRKYWRADFAMGKSRRTALSLVNVSVNRVRRRRRSLDLQAFKSTSRGALCRRGERALTGERVTRHGGTRIKRFAILEVLKRKRVYTAVLERWNSEFKILSTRPFRHLGYRYIAVEYSKRIVVSDMIIFYEFKQAYIFGQEALKFVR
ncbi:hypothetical protein EVAR_96213_1 [Eumeta japonica]|uniref:Uncharacterized protein n=1 Tax=Eumeta variegata TaxID=151549 RepID=A0A4C1WNB7_EUMVA|nr:hypothetical protein EVAR_96213_1 [Eumeta japonica]